MLKILLKYETMATSGFFWTSFMRAFISSSEYILDDQVTGLLAGQSSQYIVM